MCVVYLCFPVHITTMVFAVATILMDALSPCFDRSAIMTALFVLHLRQMLCRRGACGGYLATLLFVRPLWSYSLCRLTCIWSFGLARWIVGFTLSTMVTVLYACRSFVCWYFSSFSLFLVFCVKVYANPYMAYTK